MSSGSLQQHPNASKRQTKNWQRRDARNQAYSLSAAVTRASGTHPLFNLVARRGARRAQAQRRQHIIDKVLGAAAQHHESAVGAGAQPRAPEAQVALGVGQIINQPVRIGV